MEIILIYLLYLKIFFENSIYFEYKVVFDILQMLNIIIKNKGYFIFCYKNKIKNICKNDVDNI